MQVKQLAAARRAHGNKALESQQLAHVQDLLHVTLRLPRPCQGHDGEAPGQGLHGGQCTSGQHDLYKFKVQL